jgi:putative transcriptional regulator
MVKKTKPSRLTKALLETADDMHRVGIMDDATHQKITLRHLSDKAPGKNEPITAKDIRELREREHLSQAVFARYLCPFGRRA